jgi:hypothetical protein
MGLAKDGSFMELTEVESSRSQSHSTESVVKVTPTGPRSWSQDAQQLRSDRRYERMMNAYDVFLCSMPFFLMIKTIICIVASKHDAANHGVGVNFTVLWSYTLPGLNDQVSSISISRFFDSPYSYLFSLQSCSSPL